MSEITRVPHSPLVPEMEARVDPQFKALYEKVLVNAPQLRLLPVHEARAVAETGWAKKLEPVGGIKDIVVPGSHPGNTTGIKARVYTPSTPRPAEGYPIFLFIHGGGWVLGNIDTEGDLCAHWCNAGDCVVLAVDYRLAPEHPFPCGLEDVWDVYSWLRSGGAAEIGGTFTNLGIGGLSAGANLTAALNHLIVAEGLELPPLKFQLLIVCPFDHTATAEKYPSWHYNKDAPLLPAEECVYFKKLYLPDEKTWSDPRASPMLSAESSFAKLPPTFLGVSGLDVFRSEGEAYHRKILDNGGKSQLNIYENVPHAILSFHQVVDKGAQFLKDVSDFVYKSLH